MEISRTPNFVDDFKLRPEIDLIYCVKIYVNLKATFKSKLKSRKMSTAKLQHKTDPLRTQTRRQTTWIKSEEKLKTWRKAVTKPVGKNASRKKAASLERKSDVTRSGRLSDGTVNSNLTASGSGSSSEPNVNFKRLQDVDDIEQRESIEKCLKWMETLPSKFSGMHIFVAPSGLDEGS